MRYIPHTPEDIQRMLEAIGASSVDELFAAIPERQRFRADLDLPAPLSEAELQDHLRALGARNRYQSRASDDLCFAGAGLYRHFIPAAVDALASRSEFYTAYTPYQPELSQGTLLSIFEYQTMAAELLGMEVANASMYDGASATAEAILMARRLTGRKRAFLATGLHPEYGQTCRTYLSGMEGGSAAMIQTPLDPKTSCVDLPRLRAALDDSVAAVVVQSPNFFGVLEDLAPIAEAAHAAGAQLVAVCCEPLALALMRPPGAAGADIAVAEGIGLASPLNLGGPGLGLFAVSDRKAVRSMPGRLVGETIDGQGRRGYVLTLSTREQHIRREKATSNICTNHGLLALRFSIHLSLLGRTGFVALAEQNLSKASFARQVLSQAGFKPRFEGPTFNELAVRVPGGDAEKLVEAACQQHLVAGVALGRFFPEHKDTLLLAVTEAHTREDITRLATTLKSLA